MTYKGHVENGAIVLDDQVVLPEGTKVEIQMEAGQQQPTPRVRLSDRLASIIGKAEEFPEDWSENHDAYLRDQHRR